MNFKRYHESRNLFDGSLIDGYFTSISFNTTGNESVFKSIKVLLPAGTYTFSWGKNVNVIRTIIDGVYAQSPYSNVSSYTFTSTTDGYVGVSFRDTTSSSTAWDITTPIMLNEGSTAKPYEPYSSEVWHDTPHYIHNTSTDTITTLPAVIYANDTTATVGLKGNMEQSGTPSPQTPIQPQECGERTGNLFDITILQNNKGINQSGAVTDTTGRIATVTPIDVSQYTAVTLSYTSNNCSFIFATFNGGTLVDRQSSKTSGYTIDVTDCDELYICFYRGVDISTNDVTEIMLNTGATAKPFEPYGIKIPISSASTTTNVYLGEMESTRQIKKLVLDGTENWTSTNDSAYISLTNLGSIAAPSSYTPLVCTHFPNNTSGMTQGNNWYFRSYYTASVQDWKTYLAQQYTAGTPVTVWYILRTPTTGIVNEPLRKIGDYADEVSGITIPTTAGANTLSIGTTLQPSEITATYKGWHHVSDVHEKSRNLSPPLTDWISGYVNNSGSITRADETNKEKTSDYIQISAGESYTFSRTQSFPQESNGAWRAIGWYNQNKDFISRTAYASEEALSAAAPSNAVFCRLSFRTYGETTNTMFNTGSSALPYEPYWT